MKRTIRAVLIIAPALFIASCATIVTGRHQQVSFQSTPENATVLIDGRTIGRTPISTTLAKKSGQVVTVEKDGYKTFTFALETRTNGWFWGNIVIFGLFGSTTDSVSGAVYEYSPSQYMITLHPVAATPVDAAVQQPKSDKVRDFIIVSYNNLMSEISIGSGPYLSSLYGLLNVAEDDQDDAFVKIKELSEKHKNILEFATQVSLSLQRP